MAKLISFEGVDGSGKTTLVATVANRLRKTGLRVDVLREPGTTAMGQELRTLLKSGTPRSKTTELLMFLAARAELVEELIAKSDADVILIDRFIHSTIAYQGYGNFHGDPTTLLNIAMLNSLVLGDHALDRTFYIRVSEETSQARRTIRDGEVDRYDSDAEFAARVRQAYEDLATSGEMVTVENDGEPDAAVNAILEKLGEIL